MRELFIEYKPKIEDAPQNEAIIIDYGTFIRIIGAAQQDPDRYQLCAKHTLAVCAGGSIRSKLLAEFLSDTGTYPLARPILSGMQVYELCTKIRDADVHDGVIHIPRYNSLHTIVIGIEYPAEKDLIEDTQAALKQKGASACLILVNGSERDARMNIPLA